MLKDEPGLVVVANHPSMLDALILVARLPRSACIMKASLMRNPFLGAGARLARYIRNDSPRGMIRLAVDDLKRGGQLVIFPEGTRTTTAPVNSFRPGVTLIAKSAEMAVKLRRQAGMFSPSRRSNYAKPPEKALKEFLET